MDNSWCSTPLSQILRHLVIFGDIWHWPLHFSQRIPVCTQYHITICRSSMLCHCQTFLSKHSSIYIGIDTLYITIHTVVTGNGLVHGSVAVSKGCAFWTCCHPRRKGPWEWYTPLTTTSFRALALRGPLRSGKVWESHSHLNHWKRWNLGQFTIFHHLYFTGFGVTMLFHSLQCGAPQWC